ncbi:MAG: hypothetical protein JST01_22725 [Cyanobacteria bacterium SZAS TMP-1]|nr:hypothetical protein [Cyanobacteria bacterium SZAS TMP-1]
MNLCSAVMMRVIRAIAIKTAICGATMQQKQQIIRVIRWLAILPAAWFVNGWFYLTFTSLLILLLIPIESIFTDHSLIGKVVGTVGTCGLYFLSCLAASCTAYAIAPTHKIRACQATLTAICLSSGAAICLGSKNLGVHQSSHDFILQSCLILVSQVAVLCLTATVLNPSRFFKVILRFAPAAGDKVSLTCVAVQAIFCCIGWSMDIIDFAPSARKTATPVFMFFLLAVPIIFTCCRTNMPPRLRKVSSSLTVLSFLQLAIICCWLPSIMSYHDPTPEEIRQNAENQKQFEAQLHKQIYDGDPKAIASSKTLSAIERYEKEYSNSKTVAEILEIGKLGGTIGEIPAKHRVRTILAGVNDPSSLIASAKAMHKIMVEEAPYGRDRVLWQLTWDAMWECVRRATEFRGSTGANILAAIRADVAGTDVANSRAFDNYECRQRGQEPKWSKDEVMMPDSND